MTRGTRRGTTRGIRGSGLFLLAIAFLLLLPSRAAFAQYDTGSLIGVIQDSTGAVIPGVTVTAVNDATGVVYTGVSGSSGEYEIPNLHTGTYKVTAEHQGFSAAVANNVLVSVGVRQHIDLILKVGQTATTVEVSDVSLQVDTEDSEREQTVSGYQTEALPLVSRNFSDFLAVVTGSRQAPTAATTSSISSLVREGAYNVNGQRSMFNNFLLDGMDNNAYGESNQGFDNQIINIPPDSVAQLNVVTNNENAEYGRSSGATVNVASASGSNSFHALAYDFIRNTDLNAEGFFKPLLVGSTGLTVPFQKPTFNRNQFGMNFGGPIIRNQVFFFLDYEGFRQTLRPLYVYTLPTQNEINGDPGCAGQESNYRSGLPTRPGHKHSLRRTSTRCRPRSSASTSHTSAHCPSRASPAPAFTPMTTPRKFPSLTTPTRATFALTISKARIPPGSCASAIARRTASTFP